MPPPTFKYNVKFLAKKEMLGKGTLGATFPYREEPAPDSKEYVVKCGSLHTFDDLQIVIEKIVLSYNLDNPNILPIKAYCIKESDEGGYNFFIKMERMKRSLLKIIKDQYQVKKENFPRYKIISFFYPVVCALEYLQEKDIAHGNIKPANIFIDNQKNVKLGDIGLPKIDLDQEISNLETHGGGAFRYLAPELYGKSRDAITNEDIFKADVWSLGITLIDLCLADPKPFLPVMAIEANKEIIKENLAEIGEIYGQDFANFLAEDIFCWNPALRKSFSEIRAKLEEKFEGKIKQMLEELQEKWVDKFEFDCNELFHAKAHLTDSESTISDLDLCNMLKDFSQGMQSCKIENIVNVNINLENCIDITDEGLCYIGGFVCYHFKNLQYLCLKLTQCVSITDKSVVELGARIGQSLKSLQHLDLDFILCENLTDQGIGTLTSRIFQTNFLTKLTLNLSDCNQITDETLAQLKEDFQNGGANLLHLSLNFSNCQISDRGIKEFCSCFSEIKDLQTLALYFDGCEKISDIAAFCLSEKINEHLESLVELTLSFSECPNVDLEIEVFKQEFEDINTLKPEKINIC